MMYLALLYAMLASPDWQARESAERELVRRVDADPWRYGEPLSRWAAGATRPEVAARVLRACRVYDRWRASSYVPKTVPVWPVCDCYPVAVGLGVDIRDRRAVEPSMYGSEKGNDRSPYWHRWRRGTELMSRRMIREGVPPPGRSSPPQG